MQNYMKQLAKGDKDALAIVSLFGENTKTPHLYGYNQIRSLH